MRHYHVCVCVITKPTEFTESFNIYLEMQLGSTFIHTFITSHLNLYDTI